MAQLTLMLKTQVRKAQASAAGVTQYLGGDALESGKLVFKFASVSETITGVTDDNGLNTAIFTMTLFAVAGHQHHGGGHGGGHHGPNAPEVIVLEGSVDFDGRQQPTPTHPRDIEQAIGSVSAASTAWAQLIDKPFRLQGDKLEIG